MKRKNHGVSKKPYFIRVLRNDMKREKTLKNVLLISANVNHTFQNVQFQKDFTTPQDFGSGEFF